MSKLPVEHARADAGGALCGAKRKHGVITSQRPEDTTCKRCRVALDVRLLADQQAAEEDYWFENRNIPR